MDFAEVASLDPISHQPEDELQDELVPARVR
jgi:hypothetical protein